MAAKFAWLAITSVPVAVVINDCIIGVDIIRNQNGGAGMRAFGGGAPETAIVLSRKWMTYKFAPLKMGDHVVVLSPLDPGRKQVLQLVRDELLTEVAVDRKGVLHFIQPSRIWVEADYPMREDDTEDSCLYRQIPSHCASGKVLFTLWPFALFGAPPSDVMPRPPPPEFRRAARWKEMLQRREGGGETREVQERGEAADKEEGEENSDVVGEKKSEGEKTKEEGKADATPTSTPKA